MSFDDSDILSPLFRFDEINLKVYGLYLKARNILVVNALRTLCLLLSFLFILHQLG